MSFIDTHCHYNLAPLFATWSDHWAKAQAHEVVASLVVGTDQESNQLSLKISAATPHLFTTLGFHPGTYDEQIETLYHSGLAPTAIKNQLERDLVENMVWLNQQLTQPKVVAIGETGLDYFHFNPSEIELNALKIDLQKQAFIAQINLANKSRLPLIVHVRDKAETAYRDTLKLIQQHYQHHAPFILHCASGPLDYLQTAIELGAYVGFDGNLTYKNNQTLVAIFQQTPADRRLLETDAPFLPPQPHRGQPCEPWMISLTAEYCQNTLGAQTAQFAQNAITCFNLPDSVVKQL